MLIGVINKYIIPDEYKDVKMVILCNDCLTKSAVPFHIKNGKLLKGNLNLLYIMFPERVRQAPRQKFLIL